jgi:membrane protease YdiL (CAAX protease family)
VTERGRLIGWTLLVAVLIALAYASRAAAGKPDKDVLYQYGTAAGGLFQYGLMLGIVLALSRGPGLRERLALRRPASWPQAIGLAFGALVAIYLAAYVLGLFLNAGSDQGLTPDHWNSHKAAPYALNFLVIAGVAPVVEELTFRGLGFHVLRPFGEAAAIVLVGLAFGLVHGLVDGLPILVVFGIALAYLRSRVASVYPGMLVHAAFNSIALVAAVTT